MTDQSNEPATTTASATDSLDLAVRALGASLMPSARDMVAQQIANTDTAGGEYVTPGEEHYDAADKLMSEVFAPAEDVAVSLAEAGRFAEARHIRELFSIVAAATLRSNHSRARYEQAAQLLADQLPAMRTAEAQLIGALVVLEEARAMLFTDAAPRDVWAYITTASRLDALSAHNRHIRADTMDEMATFLENGTLVVADLRDLANGLRLQQ